MMNGLEGLTGLYDDVPDYVRNHHHVKYPLHLRPKAEDKKAEPSEQAPSSPSGPHFEQDRPDHNSGGTSPTGSVDESNRRGLMNAVRFYKVDLAWIDCRDLNAPTDRCGDPAELRNARRNKQNTPQAGEDPKAKKAESPKK